MNPITEEIIAARNGHYCHCIEVSEVYELEIIAEVIIEEYQYKYSEEVIINFLTSLEVYTLNEENEDEVYTFSFKEYIEGTL